VRDFFELPYLYFKTKWYNRREEKKVDALFYGDEKFKRLDQALLQSLNPYKLSQAFPYGETPLTSLKIIGERCGLKPTDHLYELGSGRGRSSFFLAHHFGCQVTGIEWERSFVENAQRLAREFEVKKSRFICADYRMHDFKDATHIYLYGTCLDNNSTRQINLALQKTDAKVVTVSYPLEGFEILDTFSLSFPWGRGEVYMQISQA
jgi:SAM-dependent methyltransferase